MALYCKPSRVKSEELKEIAIVQVPAMKNQRHQDHVPAPGEIAGQRRHYTRWALASNSVTSERIYDTIGA